MLCELVVLLYLRYTPPLTFAEVDVLDALPGLVQRRVWESAEGLGLTFLGERLVDAGDRYDYSPGFGETRDGFAECVEMLKRRAKRDPFPAPIDPFGPPLPCN